MRELESSQTIWVALPAKIPENALDCRNCGPTYATDATEFRVPCQPHAPE